MKRSDIFYITIITFDPTDDSTFKPTKKRKTTFKPSRKNQNLESTIQAQKKETEDNSDNKLEIILPITISCIICLGIILFFIWKNNQINDIRKYEEIETENDVEIT